MHVKQKVQLEGTAKKGIKMQFWGIESSTSRMPGGSFPILPWAESPDMQLVCHGLLCCAHGGCLPCLPLSPSHCQSVLMQVPVGGGEGGGEVFWLGYIRRCPRQLRKGLMIVPDHCVTQRCKGKVASVVGHKPPSRGNTQTEKNCSCRAPSEDRPKICVTACGC